MKLEKRLKNREKNKLIKKPLDFNEINNEEEKEKSLNFQYRALSLEE
jgi:hypothetical protein